MIQKEKDIFEKNLQVLQKHHPHVADLLETSSPFSMEARYEDSPVPNLIVDLDGQIQKIYPSPDPLKGIQDFVDSLKGLRGRIVSVFGFALGYYAVALWERYGRDNVFVIFEAFPAVFKLAMTQLDLRDMLADKNVRIVMDDSLNLEKYLTREEDVVFAYTNPKYITFHRWTRMKEGWYQKAKEALERFIIAKKSMNVTMRTSGKLFFRNRHRNLRALATANPLTDLKNRYAGYPVVIVSSGPSLAKNIHYLKDIKRRAVLIAVDSAVAPLHKNGIRPDFIASTDPNRFTYEKLFPIREDLRYSRLIFLPEATPSILDYLHFRKRYYTYLGENYRRIFNQLLGVDADSISDAQSVTHLALHGAQLMGFDPIVFVGLDLAFAGKKDHVDGTILHWGNNQVDQSIDVEDVHGQRVPTAYGFIHMLNSCENLIQNAPDRTYIDATEGGARINGTKIMSLVDVISGFSNEELLDEDGGGNAHALLSTDTLLKNIKRLKHRLLDGKSRIDTYFRVTQKIDAFFKKTRCDFRSKSLYPPKVAGQLDRADKLNARMDQDDLNLYLADLTGESNEDYINFSKRLFEAELDGDPETTFFARYEKQKFVQGTRKDAIDIALEVIEGEAAGVSALEDIKKAVDADPDNKLLKMELAIALYGRGYLAEAENIVENLRNDDPRAAFLLGCIRTRQGVVEEGVALIENASSAEEGEADPKDDFLVSIEKEWLDTCAPDTPLTFQKLMVERILMLGAKTDENVEEKRQLITTVVDKLFSQNNAEDAMALLDKAMETQFELDWSFLLQSARYLFKLERYDEGLARLQEAVELNPAAAVMWEEIGDMLFEGEDYDGAITAYENCCSALPDRRDIFRKIGDCHAASGRLEAAMVAYETAIKKE